VRKRKQYIRIASEMQIRAVAIVSLQCNEYIQNVCVRERERESDRANFGAAKCIQTRGLEACAPLIKTEPTRFICLRSDGQGRGKGGEEEKVRETDTCK